MIVYRRILSILLLGFIIFHINSVNLWLDDINLTENKINEAKIDNISMEEKFGQNLIVGIPFSYLDKTTESLLIYLKPAGIVLYQRNFDSFEQLKDLINRLQKIAVQTTKYPYFIMLDEEPDGANRMGLLKNIFTLGNPNWNKIERDIITLSSIGINVELAPLADFPFLPNSFISKRMPLKTKEDVVAFNRTFIYLLNKNKIFSTLKHFPGLGLISDDPHFKFIENDSNRDMINQSIAIFQNGIIDGASFIMTCHVIYDKLDPDNPVTFSRRIVTENLIESVGFNGIVLTDDLSDMPLSIQNLDLADAGIRALKAGHHLIMFSHNLPKTKEIIEVIKLNISKDPELSSIINSNYEKIKSFKKINLTSNY